MPDLYNKVILNIINTGPANEYMVIFFAPQSFEISRGPRVGLVAIVELLGSISIVSFSFCLRNGLQLHKGNCAKGYTMIIIKRNVHHHRKLQLLIFPTRALSLSI